MVFVPIVRKSISLSFRRSAPLEEYTVNIRITITDIVKTSIMGFVSMALCPLEEKEWHEAVADLVLLAVLSPTFFSFFMILFFMFSPIYFFKEIYLLS
jgi:hypothetical protein